MSSAPSTMPRVHISSDPTVCGGKPCIAGTRIRVHDVAVRAQDGDSPDEILTAFPGLTLSDVYAALAFYYDHKQLIDDQAADDDEFAEQLRQRLGPGPLEQKRPPGPDKAAS